MNTSGKTAPVQFVEPLGSFSRHDYLLVLIPLVLTVTAFVGVVMPVALEAAIAMGGVAGALLVIDAMFINPPTTS